MQCTDGVVSGAVMMRLVLVEGGKGEFCMLESTSRACYYATLQRGCGPHIVFSPAADAEAVHCFHQ